MADDALRMVLVVRRGAFAELARGGELAGAAAVACLLAFADDERFGAAIAAWRPRPGKVVLRARSPSQWERALAEPHALAGDAVLALPPQRRSERDPAFDRLQAMSTGLEPPPRAPPDDRRGAILYALNPDAAMSSGKTLAQIAHAAVMAADHPACAGWVRAGCPGDVIAPDREAFAALARAPGLVAEVADAGLTEIPPGTVTVRALGPR
jgi:hypothetical protein